MLFGLGSLFRAVGYLTRSPRAWPFAVVPAGVLLVLVALTVWAAVGWVQPAIFNWLTATEEPSVEAPALLPAPAPPLTEPPAAGEPPAVGAGEPSITWGDRGYQALSWLSGVLAAVLGGIVALLVTPPLSAPALEALVAQREGDLEIRPRAADGFWFELRCGLRAQAMGLLVFGPTALACWLVALLVPPASVITTPLSLLCTTLSVAWNLLDYPLTLRGVGARERFRFLARHAGTCVGFGAGFALLFWVPCLGILLLPVGVVASTEIVWTLVGRDSEAPETLRHALPIEE